MMQPQKLLRNSISNFRAVSAQVIFALGLAFFASSAFAQQTGDISGYVTDGSGNALAGVTVEASSNVLPQNRSSVSATNGRYRIRLLPPGDYEVTFTFNDGSTLVRPAAVLLQQDTKLDIDFGMTQAQVEEIVVTGQQLAADAGQGSLKNAISADTIDSIPVGQEYRDLMKLIPGVQYSELEVRGPSAGGSGQDNVYQFDGVDVSMPLFGVLGSEPSSHDIAQVSVVRGGAKAVGFNRSGGFTMNTVSKSGTDEFKAEASYQLQSAGMTGSQDKDTGSLVYDEDRSWTVLSLGGPILQDRLYFYTSYYRPERTRSNISNAYGSVGDYDNTRDEFFGKLTFAPTDNILLDASYRTSDREEKNASVGALESPTASVGSKATQDVLILEGSWVASDNTSVNFKYTNYENLNSSRPDTLFDFIPQQGGSLDVANLDQMGYVDIPLYSTGTAPEDIAFNTFLMPIVDAYSYDPVTGGGAVGGYSQIDDQDFFRESFEIGVDHTIYSGNVTHDLHAGYQWMEVAEDLARRSNGWGYIEIPGGRANSPILGDPVFYQARVQQQSLLSDSGQELIPSIYSRSVSESIEINDEISMGDWTYNVGFLFSNDVLYGQGLAPNANNPVTGLEQSPGTPYKMYEVDWKDMIQPRFGVNWDYSDTGAVYANYARYNPAASSLARAASWDRNLRSRIDVYFDANGDFIESAPVDSSSGKWFQAGIEPRHTDEFLVGTVKEMSDELTVSGHVRYRKSVNFWEDTWNSSRTYDNAPSDIPNESYIPDAEFAAIRGEIGGSSYVIAQLDNAYTKYYEASLEADWAHDAWMLHGSYTWSHYYGNFDQDNTSSFNDGALFIGSSNLADGYGRQLWDNKDGNLKGDRRHMLKLYGSYQFAWEGRAGAYLVYQSGEPWETWDGTVYGYTPSTGNDLIRYAEPAGVRTSPSHWQMDLNYTHNFAIGDKQNIQLRADIFNVFDNQTGYNIDPRASSGEYGDPRSFYRPRRIQLAIKYQFN